MVLDQIVDLPGIGAIAAIVFGIWVRSPIETVERKARALRRRAESAERVVAESSSRG